jgi:hypothetical protein
VAVPEKERKGTTQKKITHPSEVPRNGARRNRIVALARWAGGNRSALVPAPTARTGPPHRPAKKRQISSEANEVLNPAPRLNSMLRGSEIRYTTSLP